MGLSRKQTKLKEGHFCSLAGFWMCLHRPPHITGINVCYASTSTWEMCVLCGMYTL